MTPDPHICIVMPSFNQAAYLEEAITSVLSQDYPHKQLIVMDGGSKDGSVDILKKYADRLHYWQSQPDRGQSHALNQGFAHAEGDLLTWVNSDDILLPGALSAVAQAWRTYGQPQWIAANCFWLNPEGRVIRCARGMRYSRILERYANENIGAPSSFFSPKLLEQVGGVDEDMHYMMDTELWLRFMRSGVRYHRLHRYCWGLRLHPQAKMSGHNFAESAMSQADHPVWQKRAKERAMMRERHHISDGDLRRGAYWSRFLRLVSGTTPRAWFDHAFRYRNRHWSECFGNGT